MDTISVADAILKKQSTLRLLWHNGQLCPRSLGSKFMCHTTGKAESLISVLFCSNPAATALETMDSVDTLDKIAP